MRSYKNKQFIKLYNELPKQIQDQAKVAYLRFRENPNHPSLHFKRINTTIPIYSARINRDYRAVGVLEKDSIIWYWIGPYSEYDKL